MPNPIDKQWIIRSSWTETHSPGPYAAQLMTLGSYLIARYRGHSRVWEDLLNKVSASDPCICAKDIRPIYHMHPNESGCQPPSKCSKCQTIQRSGIEDGEFSSGKRQAVYTWPFTSNKGRPTHPPTKQLKSLPTKHHVILESHRDSHTTSETAVSEYLAQTTGPVPIPQASRNIYPPLYQPIWSNTYRTPHLDYLSPNDARKYKGPDQNNWDLELDECAYSVFYKSKGQNVDTEKIREGLVKSL
ncbi:uncharacterized protein FFMR_13745 [Fusarium fujikuroi]|nr:uncharacterized protein FFMR_13745 [Fusarium fujikuroi]